MYTIDYDYYTNTYGGTVITAVNFEFTLKRAISICNSILNLDLYSDSYETLESGLQDRLNDAICASCECVYQAQSGTSNALQPLVSSESVGGVWSKSYDVSKADTSVDYLHKSIFGVLNDFLSGTILVVRGVYVG